MRRRKLAHAASFTLVKIGEAAVLPLVAALDGADADFRSWIAFTLGSLGEAAGPAVPKLVKLLLDENDIVRRNAAEAIGRFGPVAREAIPALEARRADPSEDVRRHVHGALEKITALDASPELAQCQRRLSSSDFVSRPGPGPPEGIRLHDQVQCLRHERP